MLGLAGRPLHWGVGGTGLPARDTRMRTLSLLGAARGPELGRGATGGLRAARRAGGRSLAPLRSVYLHNNQLSNAGLPPDAFRGSDAIATLSLSSNRLSYLPPSLPASLERLHLQVPLLRPTVQRPPRLSSAGDSLPPCFPSSQ